MNISYLSVISLTFIWLIGGSCYLVSNWNLVIALTPNEIGDLLAGYFAPLAFLWLIGGYQQQRKQLEQNTDALKNQQKELENSNQTLRLTLDEYKNSLEQQKAIAQTHAESLELMRTNFEYSQKLDSLRFHPDFRFTFEKFVEFGALTVNVENLGPSVSNVGVEVVFENVNAGLNYDIDDWFLGDFSNATKQSLTITSKMAEGDFEVTIRMKFALMNREQTQLDYKILRTAADWKFLRVA